MASKYSLKCNSIHCHDFAHRLTLGWCGGLATVPGCSTHWNTVSIRFELIFMQYSMLWVLQSIGSYGTI